MDHTGEDSEEPVQTDQGELCKNMQRYPVSVSGHAGNHMGYGIIWVMVELRYQCFTWNIFIGVTLDPCMLFTLESGMPPLSFSI